MKVSNITIYALAIAAAMSACQKTEKKTVTETDDRGIPLSVASLLLGDSCKIDTLYASDDNVYRMIDNNQFVQKLVFDNNGLLAYNPTFEIDTITSTTYRFSDLINTVVVDFADAESVEQFCKTFPIYDDFKIITYGSSEDKPKSFTFALSVSSPTDRIKDCDSINQWIASEIDTIPFDGSFKNFGNKLARQFHNEFEQTKSPMGFSEIYSSLVYWKTTKYVTYFDTFWTYTGGAHGMYGYRFPTYMFDTNSALEYDYIFKPDVEDAVIDLICEALVENADYASYHNVNSASQVRKTIEENIDGDAIPIPAPGLLDKGVVFCYQPYEIGSFAEGAFQLVIPYDKVAPYLNEKGRALIR